MSAKGFNPDDFNESGVNYTLRTNRKIQYDNIEKYLQITNVEVLKNEPRYVYSVHSKKRLVPKTSILLKSPVSDDEKIYLQETELLQTSLPEIQEIAKEVLYFRRTIFIIACTRAKLISCHRMMEDQLHPKIEKEARLLRVSTKKPCNISKCLQTKI